MKVFISITDHKNVSVRVFQNISHVCCLVGLILCFVSGKREIYYLIAQGTCLVGILCPSGFLDHSLFVRDSWHWDTFLIKSLLQRFFRSIDGIGFTFMSDFDALASTTKLSFPPGALLSAEESLYRQFRVMLRFPLSYGNDVNVKIYGVFSYSEGEYPENRAGLESSERTISAK